MAGKGDNIGQFPALDIGIDEGADTQWLLLRIVQAIGVFNAGYYVQGA